jgi:hypothetical protein
MGFTNSTQKGGLVNFRYPTFFLGALLASITLGHSLKIDGTAPTLVISPTNPASSNPQLVEYTKNLNATLKVTFDKSLDTARAKLSVFKEQKKLAEGFGNANAYSMNSATLQGFQNYSLFAVATGLMMGMQAPSTSLNYYKTIGDDIKNKGDLYAGLGGGLSYGNIGINAGTLLPGLYVNAKYGALKTTLEDIKMDFNIYGFGINYRFLDTKSLIGILKWKGLSVGTGFYHQKNKIGIEIAPDPIKNAIPFQTNLVGESSGATANERAADSAARELFLSQLGFSTSPQINLQPNFKMGIDVSTMTIPFDAVTGVSLFWGILNITAGIGLDMNLGSSEIVLVGTGKTSIPVADSTKAYFEDSKIVIDGTSESAPTFTRMRFMTGIGIGLGPVKLDLPVIYYPASGLALGLTAAVVF